MARRKGLTSSGISGTSHNLAIILAGMVGGVMGDAFWVSQKLPFYNDATNIPQFKWADFLQLSVYFLLLFFGVLNKRNDLSCFSYGMIVGKSFTTVLFPGLGVPKYIFYDIDATTGRLVPVREKLDKAIDQTFNPLPGNAA